VAAFRPAPATWLNCEDADNNMSPSLCRWSCWRLVAFTTPAAVVVVVAATDVYGAVAAYSSSRSILDLEVLGTDVPAELRL